MKRTNPLPLLAALLLVALLAPVMQARAQDSAPAACAARDVTPGLSERTLESGGETRRYLVYVPVSYEPTAPAPLVFSLHGFASNASQQRAYSHWNALADREGFIAVYPEGTGRPLRWTAFQTPGVLNLRGADDVAFFRELLAQLQADYCIDPARIFVNGLSNGGGMSYRLGCELAGEVAAVGVVAGAVALQSECPSGRPVPMIAFHGTDDPIVPYTGGGGLSPVESWVAAWADANGCAPEPDPLPTEGDVRGVAYAGCDAGAEVIFYTVEGGGHTWPGSVGLPEFIAGATTLDVDATERMWEFFVAHPLP